MRRECMSVALGNNTTLVNYRLLLLACLCVGSIRLLVGLVSLACSLEQHTVRSEASPPPHRDAMLGVTQKHGGTSRPKPRTRKRTKQRRAHTACARRFALARAFQ